MGKKKLCKIKFSISIIESNTIGNITYFNYNILNKKNENIGTFSLKQENSLFNSNTLIYNFCTISLSQIGLTADGTSDSLTSYKIPITGIIGFLGVDYGYVELNPGYLTMRIPPSLRQSIYYHNN